MKPAAIFSTESSRIQSLRERTGDYWISALIFFAFFRILLLSAIFPPFNPADERLHFDVAVKYSQGHWPMGFETFSEEASRLGVLFGSPEYLHPPEFFQDGRIPAPLWRVRDAGSTSVLNRQTELWKSWRNMEGTQPPLYYLLAGGWYRLGHWAGIKEGDDIYWIRFLNPLIYALLIAAVYAAMMRLFPEDGYYRWSLPLLLAVFPQTIFGAINNDVLSPLVFGAAFIGLTSASAGKIKSRGHFAAVGLLSGCCILVKLSNASIFGVLAAALWQIRRDRNFPAVAALFGAAMLPIALWAIGSRLGGGDWTNGGGALKAHALGWTCRPVGSWLSHPIFRPHGFMHFAHRLAVSFWTGDNFWHGIHINSFPADAIFSSLSWLSLSIACVLLIDRGSSALPDVERRAGILSVVAVAFFFAFAFWVSVYYDFPESGTFPTRSEPFFAVGRLLMGGLVPFLFLFALGLRRACSAVRLPVRAVLIILAVVCTASQIGIEARAWHSEYNWFHLPANLESTAPRR